MEINELINPTFPINFSEKISSSLMNIPIKKIKIRQPILVKQIPPRLGCKLNIDGAFRGNPGSAGGDGIIRNTQGNMIFAFSENLGNGTNNFA